MGKTRLRPTRRNGPKSAHKPSDFESPLRGAHSAHDRRTKDTLKLQSLAGNRAVQRLIQRQDEDEIPSSELFTVPGVKLPAPGGGKPLPDDLRGDMEQSFGQSFEDVRVHEGSAAESVGAIAYTQGSDIHFAPGKYRPDSDSGRALVGHELTHVVQQRAGVVDSPTGDGAPVNASSVLEDEADRLGAQAARGATVQAKRRGSGVQRAVAPVQRNGEDEELQVSDGLPAFGSGRTRALVAFFEGGGNPDQANAQTLQQLAPAVADVAADPTALAGGPEEVPQEVHEAAAVAEDHPEAVLAEAGLLEEESEGGDRKPTDGADVGDVTTEASTQSPPSQSSGSTGGMTVSQGPDEAKKPAERDLRMIAVAGQAVVEALVGLKTVHQPGESLGQNMAEVTKVNEEVEEERSEAVRDMALEQVGVVGAIGEGFKEIGDGGNWELSGRGIAGGALAGVGVVATLANTILNVKDAVETLKDDSVDVATRVDAVGQITEALAEAGAATSSAVEIVMSWGGAADKFVEAAGTWGAAFGIVAGGVAVARGVGKGALAAHRKGKMKKIKERRRKGGSEEDERIAQAAEAAEQTNKARIKSGVTGAAKGLVPIAAGILALSGLGPVGWGIAAAVGLGSAIYAGFKWWKRRKKSSKRKSRQEAAQLLRIAKLIKTGLNSEDESVRTDYQQIAISIGASKKKVRSGAITAKELAKLLGAD